MTHVTRYSVQYECHNCGVIRPVSSEFLLPGDPGQAGSLDELYPAGDMPSVLQRLVGELVWCDDTAEYIELEDLDRVCLIPQPPSHPVDVYLKPAQERDPGPYTPGRGPDPHPPRCPRSQGQPCWDGVYPEISKCTSCSENP